MDNHKSLEADEGYHLSNTLSTALNASGVSRGKLGDMSKYVCYIQPFVQSTALEPAGLLQPVECRSPK